MKTVLSAVAIALSTLLAGQALAADTGTPKTRAEVKAELAEAVRTGNILADGESGLTLRQMHPHRYAQQPAAVGKIRAEVKAELVEAVRTGNMLADGESGVTFKQLNPGLYKHQS